MDGDQEQQPEVSEEAPAANEKKPSKWPLVILGGAPVLIPALVFTIAITLVFSLMSLGEPARNTTGSAGDTTCAAWAGAGDGYQDAITAAANTASFKIPPALLGAIFLSEHHQTWPTQKMSDPWEMEGAIKGPFQFSVDTWNEAIVAFKSQGYTEADIGDFSKAVNVAAYKLWGIAKNHKWDTSNLTDNQIRCIAAGYNKGGGVCSDWVNNGFSGNPAGVDIDSNGPYDQRALKSYKDLSVGCTSATAYAFDGISGVLKVPALHQCNSQWKTINPKNALKENICGSGCGLTSMAMIARYFGSDTTTPVDIATAMSDPAVLEPFSYGSAVMTEKRVIYSGDTFPVDFIREHLAAGEPIIWRMRNYNSGKRYLHVGGHFLVIIGISPDGKTIYTNDPNPPGPNTDENAHYEYSTDTSKYSSFDTGYFMKFWAFKKK